MQSNETDQDNFFPATAMPDGDWWHTLWFDPENVLAKIGFKKGLTAIDLCCGNGLFTVPMSQILNGNVVAVDLDPEMLEQAKKALENAEAPPCDWIKADARELTTLVPQKVDIVLIANTFHGIDAQTEMARNISTILKPGGLFIIINWHNRPREETTVLEQARGPRTELRMSPNAVREVVEPSTLVWDKLVELPPLSLCGNI